MKVDPKITLQGV